MPSATPGPTAGPPAFTVALNIDRVAGWRTTTWLEFTFTSKLATQSKGIARLTDPSIAFPFHQGGTYPLVIGPALQTTNSMADGYFRIDKGTCKSATLADFFSVYDNRVAQTIDVSYDCAKGQHFAINWYPQTQYYGTNGDPSGTERWPFPVAARRSPSDPWTSFTAPHLDVVGIPMVIGPLPSIYIEAPKMLTDVVDQTVSGGPITLQLGAAGWVNEIIAVQSTLTVANPVRLDTGEALVLVGDVNLLRRRAIIEVRSCVPLTYPFCDDSPLGAIEIIDPGGVFEDAQGNLLAPQTSVTFGVLSGSATQGPYNEALKQCRWLGGTPYDNLSGWFCELIDHDAALYAWPYLASPAYCPSNNVTVSSRSVTCLG